VGDAIRENPIRIVTIPSNDAAFRGYVERVAAELGSGDRPALEARLRRLFPRVLVSERVLSAEAPAWYVYRDGGWVSSLHAPWWEAAGMPRIELSLEGWIMYANPQARAILAFEMTPAHPTHFTDFIAPGTLADAQALFAAVAAGGELGGTILMRPRSGETIAIDLHAVREDRSLVGVFRLADDVEVTAQASPMARPSLECHPVEDAAFAGYARLSLSRMPEPTPELLAIRLHRLYPHAHVEVDGTSWIASRDPKGFSEAPRGWWLDPTLPSVRYDRQALILEANTAAQELLGNPLVGHFWQEFVTPGTTEQVSEMLAILAATGAAESRFRMPSADGSLVEFDSYTALQSDEFVTVMRPRPVS
jgi:PAS domain-containing protein